jgi:hypothetical protein
LPFIKSSKASFAASYPSSPLSGALRARLVCDLEELYRYLIDDFAFDYVQGLKPSDFTTKEVQVRDRKGRREYLNDAKTKVMMRELNDYFDSKIELPRIRSGKRQRIETLINEEALLLAKYIRDENEIWAPRVYYF